MVKDILGEAGLHFDKLNKLRVLDPEVAQQTTELKEECRLFVDSKSSWLITERACPSIQQSQDDVGGLIHTDVVIKGWLWSDL